jgi:hypothetical protein
MRRIERVFRLGGDIIGHYVSESIARGFLLTRSGPTTNHVPGAIHTLAAGINPAGDIVGDYFDGTTWRGFVVSRTGWPTR